MPDIILCDEVLSALDVSVQASIIDLLEELKFTGGISLLFISHDLAVVRTIADRVGILYHGQMLELGHTEAIFQPPYIPIRQIYCRRRLVGQFANLSMRMGTRPSVDCLSQKISVHISTRALIVLPKFATANPLPGGRSPQITQFAAICRAKYWRIRDSGQQTKC